MHQKRFTFMLALTFSASLAALPCLAHAQAAEPQQQGQEVKGKRCSALLHSPALEGLDGKLMQQAHTQAPRVWATAFLKVLHALTPVLQKGCSDEEVGAAAIFADTLAPNATHLLETLVRHAQSRGETPDQLPMTGTVQSYLALPAGPAVPVEEATTCAPVLQARQIKELDEGLLMKAGRETPAEWQEAYEKILHTLSAGLEGVCPTPNPEKLVIKHFLPKATRLFGKINAQAQTEGAPIPTTGTVLTYLGEKGGEGH